MPPRKRKKSAPEPVSQEPQPEVLSRSQLAELPDAGVYAIAWENGRLRFLVRDYQLEIYDDLRAQLWGDGGYTTPNGPHTHYILECPRRYGKSSLVAIIICELCIQRPGAKVYWAAETEKQVRKIIRSVLKPILKTCPDALKPKPQTQDAIWVWPNGSEVHLGGVEDEGRADRMRGDWADLFVIDEAGSVDLLDYVYSSVVVPMVSDRDGRVLMPSTPARTPAHPFTAMCVRAESGQAGFAHRNIYQSGFKPEQIERIIRDCGGEDSIEFEREWLAKRVVDETKAIIPEFTKAEPEIVLPICVRCGQHYDKHPGERCATGEPFFWAIETPDYRDLYTSMDLGFDPSLTAIIFGFYDFKNARLVIEDELELARPGTDEIALGVRTIETTRWTSYWSRLLQSGEIAPEEAKPFKRVSDVQPDKIWDLRRLHQLEFTMTRKDDKEGQINETRLWVKQRKIAIHPRCKKLRAHLTAGIFGKKRPEFAFINGFGHFDFIDALVYLVRNIDRSHNPYPDTPGRDMSNTTAWRRAQKKPPVPEGYEDLAKFWPKPKLGRR